MTSSETIQWGEQALKHLKELRRYLVSARRWGYWDILKGKKLVTYFKRRKIRKAKRLAKTISRELKTFDRSVQNLTNHQDHKIKLKGQGAFFDYFFDNPFYDLFIQSKTVKNLEKIDDTIAQLENTLAQLKQME